MIKFYVYLCAKLSKFIIYGSLLIMSSALPKFTLYIHTFPNNKVYIGITS